MSKKPGLINLANLEALQQDVLAPAALVLRDRLLAQMPSDVARLSLAEALAAWDGRYDPASAGALAYELILGRLVSKAVAPARREVYGVTWATRAMLAGDLAALDPVRLANHLRDAIRGAEAGFRRRRSWGRAHRLRLVHPLALVPGLRRRFRFSECAWPGSNDTVMKAAHGLIEGPHAVRYGSNARYIFDLSDFDANHLVLLGGQDGAPGSAAFLDQVELVRHGRTMQVPLRRQTAQAMFAHRTRLDPRS